MARLSMNVVSLSLPFPVFSHQHLHYCDKDVMSHPRLLWCLHTGVCVFFETVKRKTGTMRWI